MFGDSHISEDLAEELLERISFEQLLEINDLTEVDVIARLIELGLIDTDDLA